LSGVPDDGAKLWAAIDIATNQSGGLDASLQAIQASWDTGVMRGVNFVMLQERQPPPSAQHASFFPG
jgi:hypothetical protein